MHSDMQALRTKVLYIDPKDLHLDDENVFAVHPKKANWLSHFQPESFDKAVIQGVPSADMNALMFFYIAQSVKESGIIEVFVQQPITVMQALDAEEIEANAKLAGLIDIQQSDYEKWTREGDKDVKYSTVKLSMIRPKKLKSHDDVEVTKTTSIGVKKIAK